MWRPLTVSIMGMLSAGGADAQAASPAEPATLVAPKIGVERVDSRGFIHRWLLLEPVAVSGKLTETAVGEALRETMLPGLPDTLPREGDTVIVKDTTVTW